ncbi:MAG: Glyoxalase family protein [Nitrospira sp.]|jgi:PhnB protein|nr:MAG: Glyoxalase family protein [Nitrospira sp.]
MAGKVNAIPEGYKGATPYLIIKGAARALEFYQKAFGATEIMRIPAPEGKVGHAEIKIGTAIIMLADEFPDMNCKSPQSFGGTPVSIMVYVQDVDRFVKQAVSAGAKVLRPVENKFYGDRAGSLEDPFGHQWHFATHVEDVPPDELAKRAEAFMKQQGGI